VSPLRGRPAFRRLWAAGAVSETGDWLLLIALPVYVLQLTGSALTTSTLLLIEVLAAMLAGPLAGVLADRWDRRRLLIGGGLAQAVLLLPLLAVHGPGTLWIVYLVTAAEAVLGSVNDPVRQALLPATIEPGELAGATAQLGIAANLARLVGGALGGLLLQAYGLSGVVLGDVATFVLAAALLTGWSVAPGPRLPQPEGMARQWLAGLAVIRDDRRLRGTLLVSALIQLAQGMFVVLFVVFVLRRLGGGGADVGLLRGVQAVGGIAGGLLLGLVARRIPPWLLAGGGALGFAAVCLAIWNGPALTTALPLYVALFVLVGLPIAAGNAGLTTVALAATPDEYRGRMISTVVTTGAAAQGVGTLLAGLLADPVGLLPLLDAHAAIAAVAGVLALVLLRPAGRPVAQDDAGQDGAGPVRAAVVGAERVVALQPPAAVGGPDDPLDHQQVRAGREAGDDQVAGPDRGVRADEECVSVPQGRHHRRADDPDPPQGPAE
jgi:MFS family permease